ncbi:unnamed protein product [Brassica napus]|uniref:(rape) hypothetical protein n=1 Tax=Brassica napus TaxID=3708 RepID=A0A816LZ22_BRANA|nr:unnamed protein product [Brassica napus]
MGDIVLSMNYTSRKSRPFYVFYFNLEMNTFQRVQIQGLGGYYDENRHRDYTFVDHVDDLNVNDAKYLKSSRDLNIIRERRKRSKTKSLTLKLRKRLKNLQFSLANLESNYTSEIGKEKDLKTGENKVDVLSRPRDVRNSYEIAVSCSAISDDLDDSSSNSTISYGLQLPKAHVFDRGPLRNYPKLGPTFVPQPLLI